MKIIGIDPDFEKCGFCFLVDGEIKKLLSVPHYELIDYIQAGHEKGCKFAIENTLAVNAIYSKNRRQGAKVNEKISNSIGKVQGVNRFLIDYIEGLTGEKVLLAPAGVGKQTKRNAKLFNNLTGWDGRTNEDMRDAAAVAIWANKMLA